MGRFVVEGVMACAIRAYFAFELAFFLPNALGRTMMFVTKFQTDELVDSPW